MAKESSKAVPERTAAVSEVPATAKELLALIEEHGGVVRIADPPARVRAAWRRAIYALINSDVVPEGLCVRHQGRDRGDLVISVVPIEQAPPAPSKPEPIAVPETLRGAHAIVRATREAAKADREGWIDTRRTAGVVHVRVARESLQRTLLLVQGIVDEAGRRRYGVVGHKNRCEGGLGIEIRGHRFEITVREETRRVEHVLTPKEERDKERGYFYGPRWDYVPTGKLVVRDDHDSYGPPLATDRQRWSIEERLPQLFAKLEEQADAAEARRLAAERQRREEEAAMERAKSKLAEHHRREWLTGQLDAHRQARDAREFVAAALEARELEDEERTWLDWVSAYAERIDPLRRTLEPPSPPEPTPENLKPFLGGLSPYGPRSRW